MYWIVRGDGEDSGIVTTKMKKKDKGYAPKRWAFDRKVTDAFDDMLRRSIPQHDVMRAAVVEVAARHATPGTDVVDLGSSRGEMIRLMLDRIGDGCRYVGVEASRPMVEACRRRFRKEIDGGAVSVLKMDLREQYPPSAASVTTAVLVLQFTPIEYRQEIVSRVFRHTVSGGAMVLVEKVIGSTAGIDRLVVGCYHDLKRAHGYTADDISRKKLSLEGVLVPVTAKWNEDLLRGAGFAEVDCIWRWMNFAAWVAVKR